MSEARVWQHARGFIDNDPWRSWEESETVAASAIVPLVHFLALGDSEKSGVRAVRVEPADDVAALAPYLSALKLVAVTFPAFNDGRGFSQASLLRERHGFQGEIRAVGDVLIDKIAYMLRCGFDSVAVTNPTAIARLSQGDLVDVPLYYQPSPRPAAKEANFSWRRTPAA